MVRVLTRSEGQEIHCIAIEPDGEYVRVLRLIEDWSVPLEGSRYVVNGKRWRPVNPANPWERESQSFDEAVEYYKCKDRCLTRQMVRSRNLRLRSEKRGAGGE